MKLSVMIYSFRRAIRAGDMTVPEVCKFLRDECDIDALEAMHKEVTDVGVAEFKTMIAHLGQHVGCYIGSGDLVQKTDAEQQPAIDSVKTAIDAAAELGCTTMLVTTGR